MAGFRHPPNILLSAHHEPGAVYEYYRAAEVCVVSSLHDGMNLVAKEFVAARDDDRGVIVLSQFTSAARELPEAILVNPYDTDQCAAALQAALEMPDKEQRARMWLMRGLIREFNVFRWAGRMLIDAAGTRKTGRGASSVVGWRRRAHHGRSVADVDRLFPARRSGVRRSITSLVRDASRNRRGGVALSATPVVTR